MALYEKKDIRVSGLDYSNGRKCLAFDKNQGVSWQTCELPNKAICKTKNEQFMKVTRGGQQWHLSWAEYIKQSFISISKCNPITYEDVLDKPNQLYDLAGSSTWTRLTQSIEFYKYNEFNNTMIHITYGYIKRQGEHVTLNFTQDGSVDKRVLFETYDNIESSTYKTSSTATPSASTVSPAETTNEESNPKEAKQINQNSDVGVSVGISVTVISVVASIIIIVILKRRGKIQNKCFRKAESKCSAYSSTEIHPGSKNEKHAYEMSSGSPYDQIDDLGLPSERCSDNEETDNVISGHTYFILEKHTWESNTDDNTENKTKTETRNVYNTLNSNGNNTGSDKSGNTYDTTEKSVTKLKAQYHKNVDDATENTYNLTGSRPVKIGKTDNVYGVLNNVEGEYDGVDTRNVKSKFNGGDTYSHIMRKY